MHAAPFPDRIMGAADRALAITRAVELQSPLILDQVDRAETEAMRPMPDPRTHLMSATQARQIATYLVQARDEALRMDDQRREWRQLCEDIFDHVPSQDREFDATVNSAAAVVAVSMAGALSLLSSICPEVER